MSCQQNSNAAGRAAAGAGLSALSSKMGYAYGAAAEGMTQKLDQAGKTVGLPVSTLLLKISEPDRQGVGQRSAMQKATRGSAVMAGKMAVNSALVISGASTAVRTAKKVMKNIERASGVGGNVVGGLSATRSAGTVDVEKKRLFRTSTQSIDLRRSRLTPLFNKHDLIGKRDVTSSSGVMFKTGGRTWHKGTTQFKDEQGKQRTVTHLRSLSMPGDNYYFRRPVSNKAAAGIATGQMKAENVPGYVGKITKSDMLCGGAWMQAKKGAILSQIHWG